MTPDLNGWDARSLDRLENKVNDCAERLDAIEKTIKQMQSEQVISLQQRVKELENRTRNVVLALTTPIVAAVLTAVLTNVFR